jgi:integrase
MRATLTRDYVTSKTPVPAKGNHVIWDQHDDSPSGFGLVVTAKGRKSYVLQYYLDRRYWRMTIGDADKINPSDARKMAKARAGDVAKGLNPLEERRTRASAVVQEREAAKLKVDGALKAVVERYLVDKCGLVRDAEGNATFDASKSKIRSGHERIKFFEAHVYKSKLANKQIGDVKRSEIATLLDDIGKNRGPQAAHKALAFLSAMFNWHAARADGFRSPIVRGMSPIKPKERAGTRVLTDPEIRDIWATLDKAERETIKDIPPCFWRLVRTLLLTAARRTEAARASWLEIEYLRRDDFQGDVLTIPGARMKGKQDHAVPVTPRVLGLMGQSPKSADAKNYPFVFSTDYGKTPFSGYSKAKEALDNEIAKLRKAEGREPMPQWQLSRDVRRTAKTLMQRAGVRPDISERVLAHVIPGVEGVYDRYQYLPEKLDALTKLDALVDRILKTIDW